MTKIKYGIHAFKIPNRVEKGLEQGMKDMKDVIEGRKKRKTLGELLNKVHKFH